MFSPELLQAAADLRWLFNQGYPQTASIKIVGDRHRLSKADRQMLYRGVTSAEAASRRQALITPFIGVADHSLGVDGHNVLLTIANYISGIPVFEADDGLIRDIGSMHGRLHDNNVMKRSLNLTAEALLSLKPSRLSVFFDAPISHSRDHAAYLESRLMSEVDSTFPAVVAVADSGDRALKEADVNLIATSDSALIDAAGIPVVDLARYILEGEFNPDFNTFIPEFN